MPLVPLAERGAGKGPETLEVHQYGGGLVLERLQWPVDGYTAPVDIWYHAANGKELKFNDLLPAGFFIRKDLSNISPYQTESEIVYGIVFDKERYEERSFWEPGAFLKLLHEAGHAAHEPLLSNDEFTARNRLRFQCENVRDIDNYQIDPKLLPVALRVLRSERLAWANALSTLRILRQQEIDLEPELPTMKELFPLVHSYISEYEEAYMRAFKGEWDQYRDWRDTRDLYLNLAKHGYGHYLAKHAIRPSQGLPSDAPAVPQALLDQWPEEISESAEFVC